MPSPGKGYCSLRQLEVSPDQACDYFERRPGDKEFPVRCPYCIHFLQKTCAKKKNPQKDKNKS